MDNSGEGGSGDFQDPWQLALFRNMCAVSPGARKTDPETSHDAADSMVETAVTQRGRIVRALAHYGPMTADGLDEILNLRPTSAGRRLPELKNLGLVRMTGKTARTRGGREAHIWAVMGGDGR